MSTPDLAASRGQLVARLLVPRTREAVYKWLLIPVGAALAAGARGDAPSLTELVQLAVLWVVAEQLGYQARYQLNDLRDRATDAAHPAGAARGRLSFPWTPLRAALVWGSVGARVVLAVLLTALVLDGAPQVAAVWFLVLMAVVSAAYEASRERIRREVAQPGSPRARALGLPVLALIPLGYGLRVWAGFHALRAEGSPVAPEALLVASVVLLYAGSTWLAWALEGTSFLRWPDRPAEVVDGAAGRGSAGGLVVDPALAARSHIALLVEHAGLLRRDGVGAGGILGAGAIVGAGGAARAGSPDELVLARDRPAPGSLSLTAWDVASATAVLLAYAVVATAVDGAAQVVVVVAGLVSAAAPLLARAVRRTASVPGAWDSRPSWLGGGALGLTVAIELGALAVVAVALLAADPHALLVAWFLAFVLFQTGSTRASSYVRGFGPFSLVRRPLAWWRSRGAAASAERFAVPPAGASSA